MSNQSQSGKAFEYGIAYQLAKKLDAYIVEDANASNAYSSFRCSSEAEKRKIDIGASEVVHFLVEHDKNLSKNNHFEIKIQSDSQGKLGDVRDIIIYNKDKNIGISAKNRHNAVKHSRLSDTIDFGKLWFGSTCSQTYWKEIYPVFKQLRERKSRHERWRDIVEKEAKYYLPVLNAFRDELKRIYSIGGNKIAAQFLHYLLGKNDFYKIVKENGTVSIQSFNINGTLSWGKKLPLPSRIIQADLKPHSLTTLLVVFDHGWQISFRIHNASSKIEPSLKFDIQLVGQPIAIARHTIDYHA